MQALNKRICVKFEGRVQGVGFRYTVISLSSSYEVTGYVLNDYDGSVELVAEGDEKKLNKFLGAILNSGLRRYIVSHDVNWFEAKNEFKGFGIKY
ncbi:acylphosphatase [Candidatus Omnitrophota bacterium]